MGAKAAEGHEEMDGYDKPIQIDDFNARSKGTNSFVKMFDEDEDLLEVPQAMVENEKKLNKLCGID
jgi:hypothetical protein